MVEHVPQCLSLFLQLKFKDCLVKDLIDVSTQRRIRGEITFQNDNVINQTVYEMVEIDDSGIQFKYDRKKFHFPPNITTLSFGDNQFWTPGSVTKNRLRESCVNRSSYANNLETIEFSHSSLDFVYCHNVSFRYLTNFTANYAKLTGWHKALFARIPLKYFHLKGARGLAPFLQIDHLGDSFSSAPGLEVLDISGIGLSYFGSSLMFANHTNLTHLHLQNNNLHSWNLSFGGHSALKLWIFGITG